MISRLLCALFALFLWASVSIRAQQDTLRTSIADEPRWGWKSCGYDDDPVHIDSIEISPDPPLRGQNVTVTVRGESFNTIEDGAYADLTVKVGLIKILQREVDICYEARSANVSISCPVEPGEHRVVHTATLPLNIPPAMYNANIRGYSVEDDDLTCVNIWIDFKLR